MSPVVVEKKLEQFLRDRNYKGSVGAAETVETLSINEKQYGAVSGRNWEISR